MLLTAIANAATVKLKWTVPCYEARADTCAYLSAIPESTFAGHRVRLIRFSPPDTLYLPLLDEAGRECQTDSADYEVLNGTMGLVEYYGEDLAGNLSCLYASYLFAAPADSLWNSVPGLVGSYYRDKVVGALVGTRTDPQVNFNWGEGSPFQGCPADSFSVRWTGRIQPAVSGVHQFRVYINDACRLWIGPTKIIEDWDTTTGFHSVLGSATMVAGAFYDLRLEMKELWYVSGASLYWVEPGLAEALVPASALSH